LKEKTIVLDVMKKQMLILLITITISWNEYNTQCVEGENNCARCDEETDVCARCSKGYYFEVRDGYCYSTIFYNCYYWTGDGQDVDGPDVYPRGRCAECIPNHNWSGLVGSFLCLPVGTTCRDSIFNYQYCNKFVDLRRETGSGRCYCESCLEGYYLKQYENDRTPTSSHDSCHACSRMANCQMCSSTMHQCVTCNPGYFPEDLRIMGTDPKVQTPYCVAASQFENNTCSTVEQTARKCAQCILGRFRAENGICYLCSEMNCKPNSCHRERRVCTDCLDGFFPDIRGRCVRIINIPYCSIMSTVQRRCVTCQQNYYPDVTGYCYPCGVIQRCLNCSNNEAKCTTCESGSYLEDGHCYRCEDMDCLPYQCSNNSRTCALDQCQEGFTRSLDGKYCELTACSTQSITNCDRYLRIGDEDDFTCVCMRCRSGSILVGQTCRPSNYLENCTMISSYTSTCIQCREGFYPVIQTCFPCSLMIGCVECSRYERQCTECVDGMYLNDEGICLECSVLSVGCILCSSITRKCAICSEGFYLTEALECSNENPIANCEIYHQDQVVKCRKCIFGYFPDGDGLCYLCSAFSCMNNECSPYERICMNCVYVHTEPPVQRFRYNVVLKVCNVLACAIRNCMTTRHVRGERYYCDRCLPGFYRRPAVNDVNDETDNDKVRYERCLSCNRIPYCLECNPITNFQCTKCIEGYYLSSYSCDKCDITNCETCAQTRRACLKCNPTFYISNQAATTCASCSTRGAYCEECTAQRCTHCAVGAFLSGNNCVLCTTKENCLRCAPSTGACFECSAGYLVEEGECEKCPVNCLPEKCNGSTGYCYECEEGYFPGLRGDCIPCKYNPITPNPESIGSCSVCSTVARYCFECEVGTTPRDGLCYPCGIIPNCAGNQCLHFKEFCFRCESGFFARNGVCVSCSQIPNCTSTGCENGEDELCNVCLPGFVSIDQTCVPCQYPCVHCVGTVSQCTKCQDNQFVVNSECVDCGEDLDCQSCDGIRCLSCEEGMYFSTSCVPCVDPCRTCFGESSTECLSCLDNHYMNRDSTPECIVCGPSDTKCLTCPEGVCTSCKDGYSLVSQDCLPCRFPCKLCNPSSVTSCQTCEDGYYLKTSNSCSLCQRSLHENCIACSDNKCTVCFDGYYLLDNGTLTECRICNSSCSTCEDGGQSHHCISCAVGFFRTKQDVQQGFTSKCERCGSASSCLFCETQDCNQCNIGYYLDDGDCLTCPVGCSTCSSATVCLSCATGRYLKKGEGNSVSCTLCNGSNENTSEPCHRCLRGQCTLCHSDYSLTRDGQCGDCNTDDLCKPDHCINNKCEECIDGYYLNSQSQCLRCFGNLNFGRCQECYILDTSHFCTKCEGDETFPDQIDSNKLLIIIDSSYNEICVTCASYQPHCIECQIFENPRTPGHGHCEVCFEGFYKSDGKCLRCNGIQDINENEEDERDSNHCLECTGYDQCTKCEENVYLMRGFGYYLYNHSCRVCPGSQSGCVVCKDETGDCELCDNEEMSIVGQRCVLCTIEHCDICESKRLHFLIYETSYFIFPFTKRR